MKYQRTEILDFSLYTADEVLKTPWLYPLPKMLIQEAKAHGGKCIYVDQNGLTWFESDFRERGYVPCETFEQRLFIELDELKKKIIALRDFIQSPKAAALTALDQQLLIDQLICMDQYRDILARRIENLNK